eukprot:gene4684-9281_t
MRSNAIGDNKWLNMAQIWNVLHVAAVVLVVVNLRSYMFSDQSSRVTENIVMLDLAKEFIAEGALDNALKAIEIYRTTSPCLSECKLLYGRVKLLQGEYMDALKSCDEASVDKDELNRCDALQCMASSLHRLHLRSRAMTTYQSAVNCSVHKAEILTGIARLHIELGRPLEAIRVIEDSVTVTATHHHDIPIRAVLAEAYEKAGRSQDAIRCYNSVLTEQPGDIKTVSALHHLHSVSGDHKRALSVARTHTFASARSHAGHFLMAASLQGMDRHREAAVLLMVTLSLNRTHTDSWALLGRALASFGNSREAVCAYTHAMSISGVNTGSGSMSGSMLVSVSTSDSQSALVMGDALLRLPDTEGSGSTSSCGDLQQGGYIGGCRSLDNCPLIEAYISLLQAVSQCGGGSECDMSWMRLGQ